MALLFIVAGLILLVFGGDYLVKGASGIALKFDIPPMLVGMTVVALGTSAPELVVSIQAALAGKPDISVGNVVGSNIANVALILGLTTIIFPLAIRREVLRFDWVAMMLASIIFFLMGLDLYYGRLDGIFFIILLVGFIVYSFSKAHKNKEAQQVALPDEVKEAPTGRSFLVLSLFVILGSAGLVVGAGWFLEGAESVARNFGISDRVIAITLVAFGTSVPELAASVIAAFKKEKDISLGNILGSNLFNLLIIIGVTSTIHPIDVSAEIMNFDIYWMLGTSFILLPMGLFGSKLSRFDGLILLSVYVIYTYILLFGLDFLGV
jgi:cation:H+ antiporter